MHVTQVQEQQCVLDGVLDGSEAGNPKRGGNAISIPLYGDINNMMDDRDLGSRYASLWFMLLTVRYVNGISRRRNINYPAGPSFGGRVPRLDIGCVRYFEPLCDSHSQTTKQE